MVRNGVLDNAKFAMILLVVYGHLIEPIIEQSVLVKTIYLSIYSFHMPVFVILSGMLTKVEYHEGRVRKSITAILIPFLAFTFLYEIFNVLVSGKVSQYTMSLQPYWTLWFLFSLFLWKTFLPVVLNFRYPIILSVVLALVAGYIDSIGYSLGIARTLYFFPFFLIGHKLTPSVLTNGKLMSVPKIVFIGLIALNVVIFWRYFEMPHQWLHGSVSYYRLEVSGWQAAVIRLAMYCMSIVTAVAVLMLMPRTESKFSSYGANSLFVYVWHGFFVKLFIAAGLIDFIGSMPSPLAPGVMFLVALILTVILSGNHIAKSTQRYIFNPANKVFLIKS